MASVAISTAHIYQQTSNPNNLSLTCPAAIPPERFNPNACLCADALLTQGLQSDGLYESL